MYPKDADPQLVEDHVQRVAAAFKQSPGFRSITTSVDALMGPGAKSGEYGRVVIADFDTLEDVMSLLAADNFHDLEVASDSLSATNFIFECHEI